MNYLNLVLLIVLVYLRFSYPIDDHAAFSRMMLNNGSLGRERILSRAAVELMTADHLTREQRVGLEIFFAAHSSWGFGMA